MNARSDGFASFPDVHAMSGRAGAAVAARKYHIGSVPTSAVEKELIITTALVADRIKPCIRCSLFCDCGIRVICVMVCVTMFFELPTAAADDL